MQSSCTDVLLIIALASTALSDECDWAPNPKAPQNAFPINTDAPVLLRTVDHGKAYTAGKPGYEFVLIHL
jgi:hypothetical protein